jgi:hypothetical protein
MYRGYVKIWRKSLSSAIFENAELWKFWSWCLLRASHKPVKHLVGLRVIDLKPGEFIFGRRKASEELKLSEKKTRTCLKVLENMQKVAIKRTNKFSIISIVNWDTYQGDESEKGQQNGQQRASKGPTGGHKQECLKNVEEDIARSCNGSSKQPTGEPILSISLISRDGEFPIFQKDIEQWEGVYPGVDVLAELKKCQLWNHDNPSRRKTTKGIRRHISAWLDKVQNKGPAARSECRIAEYKPYPYRRLN